MKKIEVVAAIITHDDKILCMQRGASEYSYLEYKYEFPGGKIEPGESRTCALMRELKEEMDIDTLITEENHFLTVEHTYQDFDIVLHSYLIQAETEKFERKEHVGHAWVNREDLRELDWAPADVGIVEKLGKSR